MHPPHLFCQLQRLPQFAQPHQVFLEHVEQVLLVEEHLLDEANFDCAVKIVLHPPEAVLLVLHFQAVGLEQVLAGLADLAHF